jgi:hypothetical protein
MGLELTDLEFHCAKGKVSEIFRAEKHFLIGLAALSCWINGKHSTSRSRMWQSAFGTPRSKESLVTLVPQK